MAHRRRPLVTALALNTGALVVEIGAGVPAKSLSLVMDGVHNVSDEVALAFLVLAYSMRVGLSGRFLRSANLFNSLGLLAISAFLVCHDQHGVSDGLHQSPLSCQCLRDQPGEPERQVGGGIIAMGFGERREARQVNEAERRLHGDPLGSFLYHGTPDGCCGPLELSPCFQTYTQSDGPKGTDETAT